MSVPHARGYLLLRRAGGVWGIANAAVDGLIREGHGYRIATGGAPLAADEILGVVDDLRVRPPAAMMRRFWPEVPAGLAIHGELPVVVIDPSRPPAALLPEEALGLHEAAGALEEEGEEG